MYFHQITHPFFLTHFLYTLHFKSIFELNRYLLSFYLSLFSIFTYLFYSGGEKLTETAQSFLISYLYLLILSYLDFFQHNFSQAQVL